MFIQGENIDDSSRYGIWDVDQAILTTNKSIRTMEDVRWRRGNVAFVTRAVNNIPTTKEGIELSTLMKSIPSLQE